MNALISITGSLKDKGHCIVAHCPELDVYSQGYTKEEARQNLKEAVRLFLEEAVRLGTLEQILSEAGFQLMVPASGAKHRLRPDQHQTIYSDKVPFSFSMRA
jgi:predicted RNase H-like HicB family nuclease